ncbi:MAG: DUF2231 domain-containing protein [Hoeflea sp.]|uniref:DUF2231 domain-containing protein n=1 Tax=Hoeflea sp. TaxID=1940281 RepID=UPI001E0E73A3|nr:DUF2231 domain-containing protein [Hoeflea sp.]MBU4528084.1 DUF2231 domain-containing protein [Alphaproteobacteria bacterium]MBU4543680.1 DUF2231 domain-containing protein [Alphaproteobacteria bacterium]MBU4548547.1 DUF2231 domain-containing protein [Alphaproteobacteria bacterium]MBV1725713.1 DUF2231 domain-containing protein [Hoeflea sp.]MBV1762069.1 DUF2231 domain-containing protein [Hoeflea sp.]
MASESDGSNPVEKLIQHQDVTSAVAVAGHPLHAMSVHFPIALTFATFGIDILYWWTGDPFWVRVGIWSAGGAFAAGVVAGLVGTAELLLVAGIRGRVASWAHGVAAMTLIAVMGLNWGVRLNYPESVLPHGLFLSALAAALAGLAGWHGGKLIFHHGIGLMVSAKD